MSKSKKARDIASEEQDDTPTVRKLYDMVLEMGKMVSSMEQRMNEMEKWVRTKKKKVDVIEWLNQQYTPRISWEEWRDTIRVDDTHLKFLKQHDMIATFVQIFQDNICASDSEKTIRGFDKGNRALYAFSKEGWIKMESNTVQQFMYCIYRKLIRTLTEWDKKNTETCKNEHQREYNEELYVCYMKKCTSSKQNNAQLYQRMATILHKLVSMSLTDVVHVEFSY